MCPMRGAGGGRENSNETSDNGWKYFGPRHICMHKRFNRLDFMTDICFFVEALLPQILYVLRALCRWWRSRCRRQQLLKIFEGKRKRESFKSNYWAVTRHGRASQKIQSQTQPHNQWRKYNQWFFLFS